MCAVVVVVIVVETVTLLLLLFIIPSWRITFARRCIGAKLNLTSNRDLVKDVNERIIYFERIAVSQRDWTALTFKTGRTAVAVRHIT